MTARRTLWALRHCAGPHSDAFFPYRMFSFFASNVSACRFRLDGWVSLPAPRRLFSCLAQTPSWSSAPQTRLPQRQVAQEKRYAVSGRRQRRAPVWRAGHRVHEWQFQTARRCPALSQKLFVAREVWRKRLVNEVVRETRKKRQNYRRAGATVKTTRGCGKQPPRSAPHPGRQLMPGASSATGDFGSPPPPPAHPSATTGPARACG